MRACNSPKLLYEKKNQDKHRKIYYLVTLEYKSQNYEASSESLKRKNNSIKCYAIYLMAFISLTNHRVGMQILGNVRCMNYIFKMCVIDVICLTFFFIFNLLMCITHFWYGGKAFHTQVFL